MRGHRVCGALDPVPVGMENILVLFFVSILNVLVVEIEMLHSKSGFTVFCRMNRAFDWYDQI